MKLCLAGYSFHGLIGRGMMDAFSYLEAVKYRYHLDAADFWNGTFGPIDPDHVAKVKESLIEREMTVANYHVDGVHVWEDDPEARARNKAGALAHLAVAAEIGAQTVRIDMGGQGETLTAEQQDVIAGTYREYAQFAADHGFKVGPETHWGPSLALPVQKAIYEAVDHPGYGILLHIGHWVGGEAAEDEADRVAAPWAIHTHIDARITDTCLEPKLQILLDAGYQGYWGVEHHSATNEYAEVAWQLAEVRRGLIRLGVR